MSTRRTDTNNYVDMCRRHMRNVGILFLVLSAVFVFGSSRGSLFDRVLFFSIPISAGITVFLPLRVLKVWGALGAMTALCGIFAAALRNVEAAQHLCSVGFIVWGAALLSRQLKSGAIEAPVLVRTSVWPFSWYQSLLSRQLKIDVIEAPVLGRTSAWPFALKALETISKVAKVSTAKSRYSHGTPFLEETPWHRKERRRKTPWIPSGRFPTNCGSVSNH